MLLNLLRIPLKQIFTGRLPILSDGLLTRLKSPLLSLDVVVSFS